MDRPQGSCQPSQNTTGEDRRPNARLHIRRLETTLLESSPSGLQRPKTNLNSLRKKPRRDAAIVLGQPGRPQSSESALVRNRRPRKAQNRNPKQHRTPPAPQEAHGTEHAPLGNPSVRTPGNR
uniref:(northern house mosquito) hypothetical protein n=1 Tax=Culex pipiens TaxID=7175 RepID=A0A8D8DXG4_CULPI